MTTTTVDQLTISYGHDLPVLRDIDFSLPPNTLHAVIGESGAGKSTLVAALAGGLPSAARIAGRIQVSGTVGVVPQDAARSFTPMRHLRGQLAEVVRVHGRMTSDDAIRMAGLAPALLHRYPHQISGGQARRAALAAALATGPDLVLADEPTAGLDPESAAALMAQLRAVADSGVAVLVVSHDWGAVSAHARPDVVTVLRDGQAIHHGPAEQVVAAEDLYTQMLLGRRKIGPMRHSGDTTDSLAVQGMTVSLGGHDLFRDLDFAVPAGRLAAVAAPSGRGKTTLISALSGLIPLDAGTVRIDGSPLPRRPRGDIAVLWQNTGASFDPRKPLRRSIELAAAASKTPGPRLASAEYAHRAGLNPGLLDRLPVEVSGGQLQRAALARALAQRPKYLLCDEPTAHLDPVNAVAVMTSLAECAQSGVGVLVASHDLELVRAFAADVREL